MTGWEVRPIRTHDEMKACIELQEETWGPGFSERVGVSLLQVSQRIGGVAAGAWDDAGQLLGFVFGLTGLEGATPVHWSDMLAVRAEIRDEGLGRRLKTYQRRVLLERGIRTCYWTFDPLESRNAYLNLVKLGATVREYVVDMYGDSPSPLHRGIGTDRFVVRWRMDSSRVEARLVGRDAPLSIANLSALPRAFGVEGDPGLPRPSASGPANVDGLPRFLVPIPARLHAVRTRDPGVARAWREVTRDVLSRTVGHGYEVTELLRGEGLISYYLVERPRDPATGAGDEGGK